MWLGNVQECNNCFTGTKKAKRRKKVKSAYKMSKVLSSK